LISDESADKDHELLELYSKVFEKSIEAMLIVMADLLAYVASQRRWRGD
jgi:hypothetical protein|tara:strand:+ start:545 stop:691 length:147 start_codon:yes stop_codon:yes gene_type:complete